MDHGWSQPCWHHSGPVEALLDRRTNQAVATPDRHADRRGDVQPRRVSRPIGNPAWDAIRFLRASRNSSGASRRCHSRGQQRKVATAPRPGAQGRGLHAFNSVRSEHRTIRPERAEASDNVVCGPPAANTSRRRVCILLFGKGCAVLGSDQAGWGIKNFRETVFCRVG
jgi:hypothetical protein